MSVQRGTILISDGVTVTGIEPGSDGDILVYDSTQPNGFNIIKKNDLTKMFKLNTAANPKIASLGFITLFEFSYIKNEMKEITKLQFISYMGNNIQSYDIRLYDTTNSQIISSANFNNQLPTVNYLTSFSNMPADDAIFEIQGRLIVASGNLGNKQAFVNDITIIYTT